MWGMEIGGSGISACSPAGVTSSRAVPALASRWSRGRFVGTLVGGEVDLLEVEGVLDWG